MSSGTTITVPESDRLGGQGPLVLLVPDLPEPHSRAEWVAIAGREITDGIPAADVTRVIVRAALLRELRDA